MARAAYAYPLVLALALVTCVGAQTIGLTLQKQTADTKIVNVTCNELEGVFSVTVYNGFVDDRTFYVSGQSSGVDAQLNPQPTSKTVLGRTSATLFLYGPSTGAQGTRSIVGVKSQITAWMVDPTSNNPAAIIGDIHTVCGNSYSSPCHCEFFNLACWMDDCSPEKSAFFWMFIDFVTALGVSFIGGLAMVNHSAFFNAMVSHFVKNVSSVPTDDELEEKKVLNDLHSKNMTNDDLEREAMELENEVNSPKNAQIMLREAMIKEPHGGSASRYDEPEQEGTPGRAVRSMGLQLTAVYSVGTGIQMRPMGLPLYTPYSDSQYMRFRNAQSLR